MRVKDNATPAGRFVGDVDRLAQIILRQKLSSGPCCRDGYARQALVRPLHEMRPARPTQHMISQERTGLCDPCHRKRLSCGAKGLDCYR